MSTPLVVTGNDPVQLNGSIDSTSALQVEHDINSLDDYSQSLDAEHEDLSSPSATIRLEVADFSHGGNNWQVAVTHEAGGASVTWPRNGNCAYYNFNAMTDALEVDVTATSNGSPSESKTRKIWVKTKPVDGQPDRP